MLHNRNKLRSCPLGMESLESRTMLAGDVTVAIVDGDVFVRGDAAANHVVMATDDAGALVIDGRALDGAPTTINGQEGPFIVDGFHNSIHARMWGGNDVVRIPQGDFAENVFVGTGRGADRIILGPDPGGPSTDGVNVEGHLALALGHGPDFLRANAVTTGSMAAFGDLGADQIGLNNLQTGRLRIGTGPGNDRIGIANVQSPHLKVHTGLGNDALTVIDSTFARFDARMGAGNDRVRVGSTEALTAIVNGGAGRDAFVSLGDNQANHYALVGFEVILPNANAGAGANGDSSAMVSEGGDPEERFFQRESGLDEVLA